MHLTLYLPSTLAILTPLPFTLPSRGGPCRAPPKVRQGGVELCRIDTCEVHLGTGRREQVHPNRHAPVMLVQEGHVAGEEGLDLGESGGVHLVVVELRVARVGHDGTPVSFTKESQ